MITYSTFYKPIYWVVMGLIFTITAMGAPIWAQDLGLQMTWWKWTLVVIWYGLLLFSLACAFTLLGEKEPGAWYKFLFFHITVVVILAVGLWYLL
jgi:hypothetical protein